MVNKISLIVAVSKNGVIGNKGKIPWNLPSDQERFKDLTSGNVVIMGRNTFEEILAKLGKPLLNRNTIVVSKSKNYDDLECDTAKSLAEAIEIANAKFSGKEIFLCGGETIYKEGVFYADTLYITEVDAVVDGDTFFTKQNDTFILEKTESHSHGGELPYTFNVYQRNPNIHLDTLPNGNKILQDKKRFMFGIDAVLLANFASPYIHKNDHVVDLGTGNGILPLLLEKSTKAQKFTGLEIQAESVELANKSVELNGLEGKINIVSGDIKSPEKKFKKHSVEVVISNPPYMLSENCKECSTDAKTIARHEVLCSLDDVISAADFLLKTHGTFFMIHRPYRLQEIFTTLERHGLQAKRMQLVYPFVDKEPNMVLIEARKNAKPDLRVEAPIIVR